MKKRLLFGLLLALALVLAACGNTPPAPTTAPTQAPTQPTQATEPSTEHTQVPTQAPTEAPTQAPTEPAEPVSYFKDYEYRYEGRNLTWEEDVIYFAKMFLNEVEYCDGHPLLSNEEMAVTLAQSQPVLGNYFDAALTERFVAAVHDLLDRIPELNDTQIPFEMLRIVALLEDNHSNFYVPMTESFPVRLEAFFSDEGYKIHATQVPTQHSDLIYAQLLSINGVAIEEVVERMIPYVPCDYPENAIWHLADALYTSYLSSKEYLQQTEVLAWDADTATFEFLTEDGQTVTVTLTAMTQEESANVDMVWGNWVNMGYLDVDSFLNVPFWYNPDTEDATLYIRYNTMSENANYRHDAFIKELQGVTNDEVWDKIILDLRHDPGGALYSVYYKLVKILNEANVDKIFVLTNGSSFSCSFCYSYEIKMAVEKAVFVGSPTGQTMQFFGDARYYNLPNSGYYFGVANRVFDVQRGHDFSVLPVDIAAYQTLEDYKNGVDTVLELVKGM